MHRAIAVLGLGIFTQGTSEMMLAGLLPQIAQDLQVPIPQAGLLISGFAVGMIVGAPVLALTTVHLNPRTALLLFSGVFIAAHLASATTHSFAVLLTMRFVSAFVYAGFWSVASTLAVSLVPAQQRARAMSVIAGGLTLATVIGLPVGTLIGEHFGWRATFLAVTAATLAAALAITMAIPPRTISRATSIAAQARGLRVPRLWLSYAITAVSVAALLISFSYLGVILTETTGVSTTSVPIILCLYGLGSVIGIAIGGRLADAHPLRVLVAGLSLTAAVSALLGTVLTSPVAAAITIGLLGAVGFVTNPVLSSRAFALAPDAPALVPAFTTVAFNVGIAVGPAIGGALLSSGASYRALPIAGAGIAILGLALVALDRRVAARAVGCADSVARPRTRAPCKGPGSAPTQNEIRPA